MHAIRMYIPHLILQDADTLTVKLLLWTDGKKSGGQWPVEDAECKTLCGEM
jgi:hypothetical protein